MELSVSINKYSDLQKKPIASMRQAIESLPISYKQILTLHVLEGYRAKDAAQILNMSLFAFYRRYLCGLHLLEDAMC